MTQKKGAGRPAKKTKPVDQDPANDPINNESDIDQELDNQGDDEDEDDDDFDASEDSVDAPESKEKDPEPPKAAKAPKEEVQKKGAGKTEKGQFEEWEVRISEGKAKKLLKLRDNVKISEFEAETLNQGALGQTNASHHVMYFEPEE